MVSRFPHAAIFAQVSYNGNTSAFQADAGGSIPPTCSMVSAGSSQPDDSIEVPYFSNHTKAGIFSSLPAERSGREKPRSRHSFGNSLKSFKLKFMRII